MLQAALDYARLRRWHVFPVNPNNKKPLTTHGLKDASIDAKSKSAHGGDNGRAP
jgi:hypothetical protein